LLLAVMLLALGVCQSVPYLLSRVWVYEIAIGGGYFCISGGVFFLAWGMESRRSPYWLAASGLMFGLAIACRPHLAVVGAMGLAALTISLARSRSFFFALRSPQFIAFLVPLILVGAAVAEYNYLRFGNPFEFGIRYLLAGADQNRIKLDTRYVLPGLYFNLFCPPDFSPVFPWVRLALRQPFNSPDYPFPPGYFIEGTVGVLYIAPFILGALLVLNLSGSASAQEIRHHVAGRRLVETQQNIVMPVENRDIGRHCYPLYPNAGLNSRIFCASRLLPVDQKPGLQFRHQAIVSTGL
jgi:hypothetical protein